MTEKEFGSVATAIYDAGCIQFGKFILTSGAKSPIYIDLRRIRSFWEEKSVVVEAYAKLLEGLQFDLLADMPSAATPLVSSLMDRLRIPQITPRMDKKSYGSGAKIDGVYSAGQTVAVVDDLITSSKSKLEAIEILTQNRLIVKDVVVLIDRQQGGKEELAKAGYNLHAYTTLPHLMDLYFTKGLINPEQFAFTMEYLGLDPTKTLEKRYTQERAKEYFREPGVIK